MSDRRLRLWSGCHLREQDMYGRTGIKAGMADVTSGFLAGMCWRLIRMLFGCRADTTVIGEAGAIATAAGAVDMFVA